MNTRIDQLKTLHQKWAVELVHLQQADPDAAQHCREALADLELFIQRLEYSPAPVEQQPHESIG